MLDGGHGLAYVACPLAHIETLAGVLIAVAGDEHLGADLAKAVQSPFDAEVRRTGGPDGAEAGGGEHCNHRLGDVRQPARHAVSPADAEFAERGGEGHRGVAQLGVGEAATLAILQDRDDGGRVVVALQQVLRVVQTRVGKPPAAGKPLALHKKRPVATFANDAAVFPHLAPELLAVGDAPGMQSLVVRRLEAERSGEASEIAGSDSRRIRLPENGRVWGCQRAISCRPKPCVLARLGPARAWIRRRRSSSLGVPRNSTGSPGRKRE